MSMQQIMFASLASGSDFIIEGSGLFDGSSGYLSRTPGSAGNNQTFTIEMLIKINDTSGTMRLVSSGTDSNDIFNIQYQATGVLRIVNEVGGSQDLNLIATQLFRDPAGWGQLVLAVDDTQATDTNRVKVYWNGTQVTDFSTETYLAQNADSIYWNGATINRLGATSYPAGNYLKSYVARVTNIDGQALDPTSFGELTDDGFWSISDVSELTFGTNGFLLTGQNVSTGTDSSTPDAGYAQNDSIPTMTDTSAPSGTAIFDSQSYPTYAAWKAFDKSTASRWARNAAGQAGWIGYDFGTGKVIKKMIFTAPNASLGAAGEMPKNYTIDGWNGSAWVTITTITNAASYSADEQRVHTFTNTTSYTKYRVNITASFDGANCTMAELAMFEGGDGVNHFTKTGTITATNDSPTNGGDDDDNDEYGNYATLNPLDLRMSAVAATLSNGNLDIATGGGGGRGSTIMLPKSGKYKVELIPTGTINTSSFGITSSTTNDGNMLRTGTIIKIDGSSSQTGLTAMAVGQVHVMLIDMDAMTVQFKLNNANTGSAAALSADAGLGYMIHTWDSDGNTDWSINFGQLGFTHEDADYLPLATQNLPTPAVINYEDHYTVIAGISHSNGSTTAVTLPWNTSTYETMVTVKRTNDTGSWYRIDTLRGGTKAAQMEGNAPDITNSDGGFSGTSFVITSDYASGTYLLEATKYGLVADTAANEEGSINTLKTTSNNDSKAFMLTWTGTTSNGTLGHGLDVAPDFIVACDTDTSSGCDRFVFHKDVPSAGRLFLDTNAAADTNANGWQNTAPTTTLVSVGTGSLNGTGTSVMWGYASSSVFDFGSYTGNGNADGPVISINGSPASYFNKATTGTQNWFFETPESGTNNPVDDYLAMDTTAAFATSASVAQDFNSNCVKNRATSGGVNGSGVVFIYGAFGIQPLTNGAINQGRAR